MGYLKFIAGTNLSVLVVDPGKTRTNLTNKLNAQKFFLSRWILKPIGYLWFLFFILIEIMSRKILLLFKEMGLMRELEEIM